MFHNAFAFLFELYQHCFEDPVALHKLMLVSNINTFDRLEMFLYAVAKRVHGFC